MGVSNRTKKSMEKSNGAFEWIEALFFAVTIVMIFFTFFFRIVTVDGDSMLPTLHDNDKLVLYSQAYRNVQYGDIVVVTQPNVYNEPLIKRVIATEGQTVDIDFENGKVYVDGKELEEDYINELTYTQAYNSTEFPCTVPENGLFVMGDNRNHSTDSRSAEIGIIDERYVLGKAVLRIFPFDSFGTIE